MLKLSLCDYSDAYMFVKGTISIAAQAWDQWRTWEDVCGSNASPPNISALFKC